MIESFLNPHFVDALGWTLLHSLWQGAVFAIFLALLFIALRSYSAQSRYIVGAGLLTTFFITVTTTFSIQWQQASSQLDLITAQSTLPQTVDQATLDNHQKEIVPLNLEGISDPSSQKEILTTSRSPLLATFSDYYERHLPLLVTIWLLGILFLQLRFLGQLAYVQRLKHYGTELFPTGWADKIEELENKLRIQKTVSYLTSIRVESPMVIGWLQPVVLLPRHLFKSLSETEIYAVLAHELAHIRREDFVINLLQTFLCNIFFFHPGVWWMSHQIDDEREHCCDDLAVAATGPASSYAKTLINVSQLRLTMRENTPLAMALDGKSKKRDRGGFASRIHRLLKVENMVGTFKEGFTTAIILIAALFIGIVATGHTVQITDAPSISKIDEAENASETELRKDNEYENEYSEETTPSLVQTNTHLNINPSSINSQLQMAPVKPNNPAAPVEPVEARIDALVMACAEGDFDFVKTLINSGININGIGEEGFTPLMAAASENEFEIVKYLLSKGAKVNQINRGWTALIEAADEDALASMKLLLNAGAEVNYYAQLNSPTAITMAASEGHLDCLKLLLQYGADINGIGKSVPPLHTAAEEGKRAIVDYLISQKAKINHKDAMGLTALMYAASEGQYPIVKKIIESGGDASITDSNGATARDYAAAEEEYTVLNYLKNDKTLKQNKIPKIHQATQDGLIEKVRRMVEQGTDVNTRDDYGRTPLHIASAKNYNLDMQELFALGADINAQDNQGRTPLMYAAADGKKDAAILLVSRRADVNIQDVDGMRALDWTSKGGKSGLRDFLSLITEPKNQADQNIDSGSRSRNKARQKEVELRQEVDQDKESSHHQRWDNDNKSTFFYQGIRNGSIEECRQLLNSGVDINTTDNTGQTALMIAAKSNHLKLAKYLIKNGASVNMSGVSGLTALHYAALENHHQMARLLLENKAKVDPTMHYSSTDGNYGDEPIVWEYTGATPLLIAVESKNFETASILINAGANPDYILIKKEYRMNKHHLDYLDLQEVIGLDKRFLKNAKVIVSDHKWTPFKQAKKINDPAILALFSL